MRYLSGAALRLAGGLLRLADEKRRRDWIQRAVRDHHVMDLDTTLAHFYFESNLNVPRLGEPHVRDAIERARKECAGAPIYYLSDVHPVPGDVTGVSTLTPEALAAMPDDGARRGFVCAFESDEQLVRVLGLIRRLRNGAFFTPTKFVPTARYFHRNDTAWEVLRKEHALPLKKFEVADFENIIQALDMTRHLEGDYVEIGVYQGRSAHMALSYMGRAGIRRRAWLLDVFEGFTYEAARTSSDTLWKGTHTDTSLEAVQELMAEFPDATVLKRDIVATDLPDEIGPIAVCNLDVDLYEAVAAGLQKVAPRMCRNGVLIIEDAGHTPALGGALLALTEFLESEAGKGFLPIHMASGQAFLIRVEASRARSG